MSYFNRSKNIHPLTAIAIIGLMTGLIVSAALLLLPIRARATYSTIGYVDVQEALNAHPKLQGVLEQIKQFESMKLDELSDYENRTDLTDEERRQLMNELYRIRDEVDAERQRLTEPLIQDVIDATGQVGEEAGIEVVLEAGSVMWGGLNLTPLIVQKLKG